MRSRPPVYGDVYELRVALLHVEPTVWRLSVQADILLDVLHEVLQAAFGWKNCHLHDFRAGDIRFGMADAQEDLFLVDERAVPLGAIALLGSTLVYLYDFGDDWEHEIVVERVVHRGDAHPMHRRRTRVPARGLRRTAAATPLSCVAT